jgi:hypothetical protein
MTDDNEPIDRQERDIPRQLNPAFVLTCSKCGQTVYSLALGGVHFGCGGVWERDMSSTFTAAPAPREEPQP